MKQRKPKIPASFPLLLAGHLLGDFIFQTDHQAKHKNDPGPDGWLALSKHIRTYHQGIDLALLPIKIARAGGMRSWGALWRHPLRHRRTIASANWDLFWARAFSIATHMFIDRRWPVVKLQQETGSPDFAAQPWGVMVTDQALHLVVLVIMSMWIDRQR